MSELDTATRKLFRDVAQSLIQAGLDSGKWGAKVRRRSLGSTPFLFEARCHREQFLAFVGKNYPAYRFGVSNIEGTGGTHNFRVRAYCLGPAITSTRGPELVTSSTP